MKKGYLLHGLGFAAFAVLALAAVGFIVMNLWNWLLPGLIPGVGALTFIKAIGLLLLVKVVFGFGSLGHRGWRFRRRKQWRSRFQHRWDNMSAEEQAKWRTKFRSCYGWHPEDKAGQQDGAAEAQQ